ncbi:hypothetical protein TIFTF001_027218 [Ficus carica]|uniref:Ubiquitin-like domain-containing protein n=1 Tax=Ficus carica TaxID=3494 RepID=A0AA88DMQ1_FICCA|nr:hypothetical protein TIFTF001_027218 [Ficus carica]
MMVIICVLEHEFNIEVGHQEPVVEIKRKIEQQLGIPMASQTLSVSGWELLDGLDMEDYPIVTESTKIDLTFKYMQPPPPSKIPIILKFSARQYHMEVDQTETVGSLKEKIHFTNGTPIKKMSLFFCGAELEEEYHYLSKYGVCESSEIVVLSKTANCLRDEPPARRLSLVVQTSSSLLNAARIPMETSDSSSVSDLRQFLLSRKILPLDDYLFIHKQRIMRDNCSLRWHGVEDGDFLYVFKGTVTRGEQY